MSVDEWTDEVEFSTIDGQPWRIETSTLKFRAVGRYFSKTTWTVASTGSVPKLLAQIDDAPVVVSEPIARDSDHEWTLVFPATLAVNSSHTLRVTLRRIGTLARFSCQVRLPVKTLSMLIRFPDGLQPKSQQLEINDSDKITMENGIIRKLNTDGSVTLSWSRANPESRCRYTIVWN